MSIWQLIEKYGIDYEHFSSYLWARTLELKDGRTLYVTAHDRRESELEHFEEYEDDEPTEGMSQFGYTTMGELKEALKSGELKAFQIDFVVEYTDNSVDAIDANHLDGLTGFAVGQCALEDKIRLILDNIPLTEFKERLGTDFEKQEYFKRGER